MPASLPSIRFPVLVVDDDSASAQGIEGVLSLDFDVTCCDSPERALRLLDARKFHVVCSDYSMPGMTGVSLLQRVSMLPYPVGCLLVTGATEYLRAPSDGRYHVLLKPFDPERLSGLVLQLARLAEMKRSVKPPSDRAGGGDLAVPHDHDPLAAAERAAVVVEAVAVLRHDLRNKMGAVRNAAYYIRRRAEAADLPASDPRVGRFFDLIDTELTEASSILEHLGPLAPLLPRRPEPLSPAGCASAAAASARLAGSPAVRVSIAPGLGDERVDADRDELTLALRCLIENSAEAMPDGGLISISVAEQQGQVTIEVSDQGPGIPPSLADDVLRAFFTTKQGHAGLGLNIAARVARRAGGSLELARASEPWRVRLIFPASRAAAPQQGPGG